MSPPARARRGRNSAGRLLLMAPVRPCNQQATEPSYRSIPRSHHGAFASTRSGLLPDAICRVQLYLSLSSLASGAGRDHALFRVGYAYAEGCTDFTGWTFTYTEQVSGGET